MLKNISLWSIEDYQLMSRNEPEIVRNFWMQKYQEAQKDHFNVFIRLFDNKINKNQDFKGLLANVPVTIKDNLCTNGIPTTCASKMLENWIPDYDATVIEILKHEGSYLVGKTNLDEFAMGNTTRTSYYGPTCNPWDEEKRFSPGGSSGGAAASVALGFAPIAIASDTGGSIRCPASWTGVLGLKPTYGRVSRFGLVSYAHTLDQIGIISRYAQDASITLEIISKPDFKDMTNEKRQYKHQSLHIQNNIIIGIIKEFFDSTQTRQELIYSQALQVIEDLPNIEIKEIQIPNWDILLPTYYVIASGEAYSNLARYTGEQYGYSADDIVKSRLLGFGEEVLRRLDIGKYSLKQGFNEQLYRKAQSIRDHFRNIFKEIYKKTSVLALPTMFDFALAWEENISTLDSYQTDLLTVPANLLGIPALSLPVGFGSKLGVQLPLGLQLLAPWWNEKILLQIAWEYQQKTTHHLKLPETLLTTEEKGL